MNWDDLKVFLAVGRHKTMSSAAKHLNVQHSTISRRVKFLEKTVGTNLLRRNGGVYEMTSAGQTLFETALNIEAQIVSVDGTILKHKDPLTGPLRITTIDSLASSVFMPMLADFTKTYPDIDMHVLVTSETLSLTKREADIAIRLSNSPTETLIGQRLVTVKSTAYGSKSYLEKHRESPEWLGVDCCGFHKAWTKDVCRNQRHPFNCDDAVVTLSAIKAGLGISFLPCYIGDEEPELERVFEPDPKYDLGLWILIHPESKNNARIIAFREHMIDAINKQADLFMGNG